MRGAVFPSWFATTVPVRLLLLLNRPGRPWRAAALFDAAGCTYAYGMRLLRVLRISHLVTQDYPPLSVRLTAHPQYTLTLRGQHVVRALQDLRREFPSTEGEAPIA